VGREWVRELPIRIGLVAEKGPVSRFCEAGFGIRYFRQNPNKQSQNTVKNDNFVHSN
jgi:hypothetical protein